MSNIKDDDNNSMDGALFDNLKTRTNLLTAKEVARILNVSPKTVYKWHKLHRLQGRRLCQKVVRFMPTEVLRFIDEMASLN